MSTFPFINQFLRPSLSSRSHSSVLEIDLTTDGDEAALGARCPTLVDHEVRPTLLPMEVLTASGKDTERLSVAAMVSAVSPKRLLADAEKGKSLASAIRLQAELRHLQTQLKEVQQTARDREPAELLRRIHELERENTDLRGELDTCKQELKRTDRFKREVAAEEFTLTQKIDIESEATTLQRTRFSLAEIDSLQREIESLRLENSALRSREVQLSDELISATEHIKMLEIQLLTTESAYIEQTRYKEAALIESKIKEQKLVETTSQALSQAAAQLFDPAALRQQLADMESKRKAVLFIQVLERLGLEGHKARKTALELEAVLLEGSIDTAKKRLERYERGHARHLLPLE